MANWWNVLVPVKLGKEEGQDQSAKGIGTHWVAAGRGNPYPTVMQPDLCRLWQSGYAPCPGEATVTLQDLCLLTGR